MNQTERLYKIQSLLHQETLVPRKRFIEVLEISVATFKRDLAYLRDRLHAPIAYDAANGGYCFVAGEGAPRVCVPGMWFSAAEIYALLSIQEFVRQLQPGLLSPYVHSLRECLNRLNDTHAPLALELQGRIRIHRTNARTVQPSAFDPVCEALLGRRRISINYRGRVRNVSETRIISPQRLTYYRDNWYLDAWCHLRNGMRLFSLDAISRANVIDEAVLEVPHAEIEALSKAGYGIFAGPSHEWAILRFSPERARWVSCEVWHPLQESAWELDGHYVLRVPYSDDRELLMDILRHIPEVVVLGPPALQGKVRATLVQALADTAEVAS